MISFQSGTYLMVCPLSLPATLPWAPGSHSGAGNALWPAQNGNLLLVVPSVQTEAPDPLFVTVNVANTTDQTVWVATEAP